MTHLSYSCPFPKGLNERETVVVLSLSEYQSIVCVENGVGWHHPWFADTGEINFDSSLIKARCAYIIRLADIEVLLAFTC